MQGSQRDTDVKNRLLDSVGKGEGEMISENSIETCVLPYVKQMTCASLKQEAGHSKPGALGHPRGMGWGGRRERVQDEGHMCTRD